MMTYWPVFKNPRDIDIVADDDAPAKARELVAQINKTLIRAENVEPGEDEEQVLLECRETLSESYFCIATLVAKLQRARGIEITDVAE
jgi:hypothetical protein